MSGGPALGSRSAVAVLGGGFAGMQAALLLAARGREVFIVERGPSIGGHFPLLDRQFPTDSCGVCFMSPAPPAVCPIHECRLHPNVRLLTLAELAGVAGGGGDFTLSVRRRARFVDEKRCTRCGKCVEACPVTFPAPFGGGVETRRAIDLPFPQAVPNVPFVDPERCTRCGKCVEACPEGAVDLEMPGAVETIRAGAVLMAEGFEPFGAERKKEFGFGRHRNVLTAVQFERLLSTGGPTGGRPLRPSDGRPIRRLAFLHCVGSRDAAIGREACSTVCCMYAVKQAILAAGREPGLEASLFCMDLRPMGKGYEEYVERGARERGLRFRRCSVSAVREHPRTGDLLVASVDGNGAPVEEAYDAVVLATGFDPSPGTGEDAALLGVALDERGFCATRDLEPVKTSVAGVFAAGASRGPRDIPETVVEACAAAAAADLFLSDARPAVTVATGPVEGEAGNGEPRIALVLDGCRGRVSDVLDLARVRDSLTGEPGVARCQIIEDAASIEGQDALRRLLGESGADRVVLAGAAARDAGPWLRELLRGAGINPHLSEHANLLTECAAVHADNPPEATRKAVSLVRMALERSRRGVAIRPRRREPSRAALVIGGGAAGLTAALTLADEGVPVHLVERESVLGGNLRQGGRTLRGADVEAFLGNLEERVRSRRGITLHLGAVAVASEGEPGFLRTTLRTAAGDTVVEHGALVVATGGRESEPHGYGHRDDPRVMTQRAFEGLLREDPAVAALRSVVMIQCVGSRDGERPWCSRVCCAQAVGNALALGERNPRARVFVLHRDVRTPGADELFYGKARRSGVVFVRFDREAPPVVSGGAGNLTVTVRDSSLERELVLEADLVVLGTGIDPEDTRDTARVFGLERGTGGFLQEANPKAAPLDALRRGVYLCGLAHSPNRLEEVVLQGMAAAGRAAAFLAGAAAEEEPRAATVNPRLCCGCALCVEACPYGARSLGEDGKAGVNAWVCRGCGSCAAVCRNGASGHRSYEKKTTLAVIDAALE